VGGEQNQQRNERLPQIILFILQSHHVRQRQPARPKQDAPPRLRHPAEIQCALSFPHRARRARSLTTSRRGCNPRLRRGGRDRKQNAQDSKGGGRSNQISPLLTPFPPDRYLISPSLSLSSIREVRRWIAHQRNSHQNYDTIGLGSTVPELDLNGLGSLHLGTFDKTLFSMIIPPVEAILRERRFDSVVILGIEVRLRGSVPGASMLFVIDPRHPHSLTFACCKPFWTS